MAKETPGDKDLEEIQILTLKSAHLEYFFRNLTNPRWFPLLNKAGYFKKPIAEIHYGDGTISCPSWPQSTFLLKCTMAYPKEIADIIIQAAPTENARAHQELIEVAKSLPGPEGARVVPVAKKWIQDRFKTITALSTLLGELVAKLAKDNELKAAFDLAYAITKVSVDEEKYAQANKDGGIPLLRTAEGYIPYWDYAHMMDQFTEALYEKDPFKLIEFLYSRLNEVLYLENRSEEEGMYLDYSYIWRPAIEDNEQDNGVDDLRDILINRLRNYSLKYIDDNKAKMTQVFKLLQRSKFPLPKRIKLYLLSQKPRVNPIFS